MQEVERLTYTAAEVAQVLGISRSKAYKLFYQEDFPSFRIGTRPVIRRTAFEDWIKEQEGKKGNEPRKI